MFYMVKKTLKFDSVFWRTEIISKELNERIKHKLIPAYKDLNEAFYSGGFGYISYECFKYIEPTINNIKDTKTYTPESGFIFPKELLIFDNKKLYIYIVCLKQNRLKKEIKKRQKEIQEKIIYLSLPKLYKERQEFTLFRVFAKKFRSWRVYW